MKTKALAEASHPRSTCLLFPALLNTAKLDGALACFGKEACLLTQDATAIHGRERIRPILAQLIARRAQIIVEMSNVLVAGDVAMAREHWRIGIDGVEGARFEQSCDPGLILHRIEGLWKLALLAPWGWGGTRRT
jgi:ketosteroid isomerase-like protein